jgi:hypothetical protein
MSRAKKTDSGSSPATTHARPAVAQTQVAPGASTGQQGVRPVSEEQIRLRAYQKWEAANRPPGDGQIFWLEAERELRGR